MLDTFHFDSRFTCGLPADSQAAIFRRQVHGACYSRVAPTAPCRTAPDRLAREVTELIDITPAACESPEFMQLRRADFTFEGSETSAPAYKWPEAVGPFPAIRGCSGDTPPTRALGWSEIDQEKPPHRRGG